MIVWNRLEMKWLCLHCTTLLSSGIFGVGGFGQISCFLQSVDMHPIPMVLNCLWNNIPKLSVPMWHWWSMEKLTNALLERIYGKTYECITRKEQSSYRLLPVTISMVSRILVIQFPYPLKWKERTVSAKYFFIFRFIRKCSIWNELGWSASWKGMCLFFIVLNILKLLVVFFLVAD